MSNRVEFWDPNLKWKVLQTWLQWRPWGIISMTSPSPLNAGAIIVKCVHTPSLKPYQWRPRSAVAKSCLHFQFTSFAFSTELGWDEELLCLLETETGQGLWKPRMGFIAVRWRGLKTLDSTLAAIFAFRVTHSLVYFVRVEDAGRLDWFAKITGTQDVQEIFFCYFLTSRVQHVVNLKKLWF